MIARMLTLDGTLHRVSTSGTDEYNNPATTTSSAAVKCWIEQARSTEETVNASVDTDEVRVYLDASAGQVEGRDSLTVAGTTYGFTGPGWQAIHPRTGRVSHIEAQARRVA